jgi:hypothetical protein
MPNPISLAGPDSKYAQVEARPAGFLAGYWHGLILPMALIWSAFNPNVRIYETKNCGRMYDLGFLLGIASSQGGLSINITR